MVDRRDLKLAYDILLVRGAAGHDSSLHEDWLREAGRGTEKEGAQGVGLMLQLAQLRLRAAAARQSSSSFTGWCERPGRG